MRHIWLWFALAFAVTLFGFWPTTLGRLGPPDTLRMVHGVFAVTWMLMLVVQSWLIGHGHWKAHRWEWFTALAEALGLAVV